MTTVAAPPPVKGAEKWTEQSLWGLLQKRYPANEYALLRQVRNATGATYTTRYADALALSLWPSRGVHLSGFEIKVARGDWLKELRAPAKAEEIAQYCHYWWLVVPGPAVAQPAEVPDAWGLMYVSGDKLIVQRQATKKDAEAPPWLFLASIFRNVAEQQAARDLVPRASIQDEINSAYQRGYTSGSESEKRRYQHTYETLERLQQSLKAFEEASGVRIDSYAGANVGATFRLVQHASPGLLRRLVERHRDEMRNTVDSLSRLLERHEKEWAPEVVRPLE